MLGRRALLTGLLLGLSTAPALAQNAAPTVPRADMPPRETQPRRQRRQAEKTVTAPEPQGQPAPIPNRDIEAPRANNAPRASLSPALINPDPAQPHLGRSGFAVQSQVDRLNRQPAPGARLNVPF